MDRTITLIDQAARTLEKLLSESRCVTPEEAVADALAALEEVVALDSETTAQFKAAYDEHMADPDDTILAEEAFVGVLARLEDPKACAKPRRHGWESLDIMEAQ